MEQDKKDSENKLEQIRKDSGIKMNELDNQTEKELIEEEDTDLSEIQDQFNPQNQDIEQQIKNKTQKPYSLSNPRESQIRNLSVVRKKNWVNRIFRPISVGSLRGVVLLWVRMTMGVGILTLPALLSSFGIVGGIIALFIGMLICLFSYRSIFYVTIKTQIKEYSELVKELLPTTISQIFKFTYFFDMISFAIVYSIFAWKLFEFLCSVFGMFKQEWYSDYDKLELNEYHPSVLLIRIIYYVVLYIILIPLLIKKSMDKLKPIAMIFLGVIIVLVIDIMLEAPYFRQYYLNEAQKNPEKPFTVEYFFKKPSFSWIPLFFSLILSYYVQPFVLVLRKELLAPSHKRLNKVAFLSVFIEFVLYVLFGVWIYFCFGDQNLMDLIILRKAYPGKNVFSEYIFNFFIILFLILNNLGLSVYNPGMRQYLQKFIKFDNEQRGHIILSLLPLFIAFTVAILSPDVLRMFWIIGLVFCNFNGFIIPAWLRLAMYHKEKAPLYKIWLVRILICFYIVCGILGVSQKILEFQLMQIIYKFQSNGDTFLFEQSSEQTISSVSLSYSYFINVNGQLGLVFLQKYLTLCILFSSSEETVSQNFSSVYQRFSIL